MTETLAGLRRAGAEDRAALEALQRAAYAANERIIGRTPIPLEWDYGAVLRDWEVWLADRDGGLAGALILDLRPDDLYIENLSVAPAAQGSGLGNRLLAAAELRAGQCGRDSLRLLTNALMVRNVDWYARKGFAIERIEEDDGRRITHMVRRL
ncbi:GNAT family N-acetyltransferase [Prosthecodimorpha staleyi]|uniref:GNAT family N-acetyltransferase n=1 Tax=Prosthecodimorpha staleyi TaxID=2840188 RepID=A0A947DBX1_9HYPH|nr:GNAT family N-acetyltransferase [Prosthecodimorpha staleyi]MBT9293007.1 GNAT family N-acetyltransferase [Prosthecodimorpha staleyi]